MCEMCSLIVTSRYFPTGTHRPLHMTKIQRINRTLDNNVIQKRPFCPILSHPSMSPRCDMLRLTHSNVFQMCPSVSTLIRCHRALHYFIFHSRMLQIKPSSLSWPTADARQRSPHCLIGFVLFCCVAFGKKADKLSSSYLPDLEDNNSYSPLPAQWSDFPKVFCADCLE